FDRFSSGALRLALRTARWPAVPSRCSRGGRCCVIAIPKELLSMSTSTRPLAQRLRPALTCLAALLLAGALPSWADAPESWAEAPKPVPQKWREFIKLFDSTLEKNGVVGGSVALVENGRAVARHHYGYADRKKGIKVDDDTIFHWASITKTLNAIAM